MAISLGVGFNSGSATSSAPAITLTGCTAGRALLCGVILYNSTTTISSVTVTGESNAIQFGTQELMATPDGSIAIYHRPLTASGDKTVTFNLSVSETASMFVMEVQGQAASPYGAAILQNDVVVGVDWITQAGNITLDGDQSMLFAMSYSNDVPSNTLIAPFDNIQTIPSGGWFSRAFWKFNAGNNGAVIPVEFNMESGGTTNRHGFIVVGYKALVSTVPTLSAAGVNDLTATSARPKITLAF